MDDFAAKHGEYSVPLLLLGPKGEVRVFATDHPPTPVSGSPSSRLHWIGPAPRQRGSKDPWPFQHPNGGCSSTDLGRIWPKATTTDRSAFSLASACWHSRSRRIRASPGRVGRGRFSSGRSSRDRPPGPTHSGNRPCARWGSTPSGSRASYRQRDDPSPSSGQARPWAQDRVM